MVARAEWEEDGGKTGVAKKGYRKAPTGLASTLVERAMVYRMSPWDRPQGRRISANSYNCL